MESKSVHLLFFAFLIKLYCRKMFQIEVWSKGGNIKRNISSTSTSHNYSLLIAISEACVKIKTVFNTKNLVWYPVRSTSQSSFSTSTHSPEETLLHVHQGDLWSPFSLSPLAYPAWTTLIPFTEFTSLLAPLPSTQRCIHNDLNALEEGIKNTPSK